MIHKMNISISGMHCASCAVNIQRALSKEEGVKSVVVNFATENAVVEFDMDKISHEKIRNIVDKLGYEAEIEIEGGEEHAHHADVKAGEIIDQRNRFIFSLILALPLAYLSMGKMLGFLELSLASNQFRQHGLLLGQATARKECQAQH